MSIARLCSVTAGGSAISSLVSASWSPGIERILTAAAGNHQAEFVHLASQVPRVSFETRKIDALSTVTLETAALYYRVVAEGGTGGSSYISLVGSSSACLCVPRQMRWQKGSPAVLSAEIIFLSTDGSTAPITVGTTAGDLTADAAQWSGDDELVSSITVDFGFNIALPPDGRLYQKHCFIESQRPSITIVTSDAATITQANVNPGAIATLTAVLKAVATGGVRGTSRSYAVTGHKIADAIGGMAPANVTISCAGLGGVTIS